MSSWKPLFIAALALAQSGGSASPLTNFRGVVRDPASSAFPETTIFVQRWDWDMESKQFRAFNPPPIHIDSNGKFATYLPPGVYDVFVSSYWGEPIALKVEVAPTTPTELECDFQLSPLIPSEHQLVIDYSKPQLLVQPGQHKPSVCVSRKGQAP